MAYVCKRKPAVPSGLFIWTMIMFIGIKQSRQFECGLTAEKSTVLACDCYPAAGYIWCANKQLREIPVFPENFKFWYIDLSNNLISNIKNERLLNFSVVILHNNPLNCSIIHYCKIKSHCQCKAYISSTKSNLKQLFYSTIIENNTTYSGFLQTNTLNANTTPNSRFLKRTTSIENTTANSVLAHTASSSPILGHLKIKNLSNLDFTDLFTTVGQIRLNVEKTSINTTVELITQVIPNSWAVHQNVSQTHFCCSVTSVISKRFTCFHLIIFCSGIFGLLILFLLLFFICCKRRKVKANRQCEFELQQISVNTIALQNNTKFHTL
jgi:hypothetical protein